MMADLDGSSIIGAAQVGSTYGYGLIWLFLALVVPLYVIQEVSGRVGVVTEKGLGELAREKFGRKLAAIVSLPMFATDVATYVVEYLSVGIALEVLGIPLYVGVPLAYLLHLFVVVKRGYVQAEKALLGISFAFVLTIVVTAALRGNASSGLFLLSTSKDYVLLVASSVGAVIMPFMLFFQASATAEKVVSLRVPEAKVPEECKVRSFLRQMRTETLVGAIVSEVIMALIEMAFTGTETSGDTFASGKALAEALSAVAGGLAPYVFALGLSSAAFLALVVISLGSAWGVAEALGLGRQRATLIYVLESLPALAFALLLPAENLMVYVLQILALFTVILAGPLVVLGLIARDERIMGDFRLRGWNEVAYWGFGALVVGTGVVALIYG
ncbi:MAG: NRAMP family divalent metal transporter [Thermoprotei archaeon]